MSQALTAHTHAKRSVRDAKNELEAATAELAAALEAQHLTQTTAAALQETAHKQINKVVTRCVRACGWDYDFRIEFLRKRGRTEARPGFFRGGVRVDPTGAAGGGVVDMAALALRLAALVLATPRRRRLMVLDEPFRAIHGEEERRRAAELVNALAEELGVQFIVATGLEWMKIGKVIELR